MASPWPAQGLLSITCCSYSRCVPGRINSRPGRLGEGAESSGRPGTVPRTGCPLPLQAACASGRATCCCFSGTGLSAGTQTFSPGSSTPQCPGVAQFCFKILLTDWGLSTPGFSQGLFLDSRSWPVRKSHNCLYSGGEAEHRQVSQWCLL